MAAMAAKHSQIKNAHLINRGIADAACSKLNPALTVSQTISFEQ